MGEATLRTSTQWTLGLTHETRHALLQRCQLRTCYRNTYNERARWYTTPEVQVRTTLWIASGALRQTKGTDGSYTCRERVSSIRSYPWDIKGQAFLFLTHKHTCCNTLKAILLSSLNWSRVRTRTSITPESQISRWILGMAILPAGSDICRISDPSGTGSGTKFNPRVLPVPDPILLRVGYGFDFLPAGTRRISENSDLRFSTYQYAS
jgi:hypothetical protein